MKRYIEGEDRTQITLMPECLEDYVGADNPVRVVEAFVEQLDLHQMRFEGIQPLSTGALCPFEGLEASRFLAFTPRSAASLGQTVMLADG